MEQEITPGWYHSAMWHCPYRIHVHCVHEGRVYFSRREFPGMSIATLESFRGLVVLE